MKIRLAEMREVEGLNALIAASARGLSREDYSAAEIESAVQYVFGVDTELLEDGTYYAIEDDEGKLLACGGWSMRKTLFGGNQFFARERSVLLDPTKDAAKIRAFFVHPDHARRGLGRMLLNHCEQEALQAGFTAFEMMATLPGVKLYQVFGYEKVRDEESILPNGVCLRFARMHKHVNILSEEPLSTCLTQKV